MGRSKEKGKAVQELTLDELKRELHRCETLSGLYRAKVAKGLKKRLVAIKERLRELGQLPDGGARRLE